ncbi:MAG: DMT family transporter [Deltaproteobacteria bacterium]|nr:DMT family transporter [Deltaproteobacteria bacterium]
MDTPLVPGPVYALLTALAWSGAVILFKKSGDAIHPVGLNTFKNVLALPALALTWLVVGAPASPTKSDVVILLASGVLGIGVADTLFFHCLRILGASRTAIVECAYSPSVVVIAYVQLGETLTGLDALGALLIVGAVLLTTERKGTELARGHLVLGVAYGIAAVALMAFAIVWAKPVLAHYDVLWSTTIRMVGGVGSLLVLWVLSRDARAQVRHAFTPQPAWRYALPGAFLGTYVSLLFWIAGFKYTAANIAALLNQTNTILVVVWATLFLREPLTVRTSVAVVLACAGSVLVLI